MLSLLLMQLLRDLASAEVQLRRRQCCRVPLVSSQIDAAMTTECEDCSDCGYDRRMPTCPIEQTNEKAEFKVYAPRGTQSITLHSGARLNFKEFPSYTSLCYASFTKDKALKSSVTN